MSNLETTLGGSREGFPETVWSSLLGVSGPDTPEREAALNELARLYWRPVYKFIRTAGRASIEDAKDLTQEFFGHLLAGEVLAKYDREKGRFRGFLKGVLRNFLSAERRDATRQKRGGGRVVLSLDVEALESGGGLPQKGGSPEEAFDRQWAAEILSESVAELRRQLAAEGRPVSYTVYERYTAAANPEGPTYASLGRELGLNEQQVKDHLSYARARLEKIVRDRVASRVASPAELAGEMKELLFG